MTAQELIAQNRQQHEAGNYIAAKRLDLGNCGLTDLDTQVPELFTLTHLEELVLGNKWITGNPNKGRANCLRHLPAGFAQLPNLQHLDISNNQITKLENLDQLPNLQRLDIRNNQITKLENLDQLPSLQHLDISENQITKPENLDQLPSLQQLNISKNQITKFENLDQLPNLQQLYISYNKITKLENLDQLPNLQQLDISGNEITKLENLDQLPSLQQLYISYNKITKLENLDQLPNLQQLDISGNEITKLENLDQLPSLQQLYISENQITKLENLDQLPSLQQLYISSNQITKLENLDKLRNLQQLDISGNEITKFENLDYLPSLQELYISYNKITKIENLDQLPSLQQLNISFNQITKLENLDYLPNLQQLHIIINKITKLENLDKLPSLQQLDISGNEITKLENLDHLPNLQHLDISGNEITKLENLDLLPSLQQLDISFNPITKLENLDKLPSLQQLHISSTKITKLENLDQLPNLQQLYISSTKITKLENLDQLPSLQQLYIRANQITKLENLDQLPSLQHLDISGNKITKIENLDLLPNLQQLDISDNQITKLENLDKLPSLQQLYIRANQITKLENLDYLPNLQKLDIKYNQITKLENLDQLPNLQQLNISRNQITKLESTVSLPNLQQLDIKYNQITKLENLDQLPNLEQLDISYNKISSNISLEFLRQFGQLSYLNVQSNPLGNIRSEINLGGNCLNDLQLLLNMEGGSAADNEVKVLLIGNGSVGKTQIAKRLELQEHFIFNDKHDSTQGITLLQRKLYSNILPQGSLQLNLWDFGGQDLYHATHRLFMSTRALFLLVWDIESENADHHTWKGRDYRNQKLLYWLAYTKYFADGSPILVVQNKIDAPPANLSNPYPAPAQNELKEKYPAISGFVDVSAENGKGFIVLERKIADVFKQNDALKADSLKKELYKTWIAVRERIRKEQQNPEGDKEISFATFEQWCKEAGTLQSAQLLLGFLHNTGVLYYRADYFGGRIIINQAWAIDAVYRILDRKNRHYEVLEDNKGKVSYDDIVVIWAENTDEERELFIDFMLSSELCFETTPNKKSNTPLTDRTFIVPQLLPETEPDYIATEESERGATFKKGITFDFLPSVFIQRFIIRAHHFSTYEYTWQHGIALQHKNNAYAVVRALYSPEYAITINYNEAAQNTGLLKAIEEELEKLQNEDSNKPKPEAKKEGFNALRAYSTPPLNNNNNKNKTHMTAQDLTLERGIAITNAVIGSDINAGRDVNLIHTTINNYLNPNQQTTNTETPVNVRATTLDFIQQGMLKEALMYLKQQFPDNLDIVGLQGRYASNERDNRRGILNIGDYKRELNIITNNTINLLNEILP